MRSASSTAMATAWSLMALLSATATLAATVQPATENIEYKPMTFPLNSENAYGVNGLFISKQILGGKQYALGEAIYRNDKALIKCSYDPVASQKEEEVFRTLSHKALDSFGQEYIAKYIYSFPITLSGKPLYLSKNKWPSFLQKTGRCFIIKNSGNMKLRDYIRKVEEQSKPAQLLDIANQVLKGLRYINTMGLIHLDINLDNIWIASANSKKPKVFIMNFEQSLWFKPNKSPSPIGNPGMQAYYLAFEQFLTSKIELLKLQSWQVGSMMYEVYQGRTPLNDYLGFPVTPADFKKAAKAISSDSKAGTLVLKPRKSYTPDQQKYWNELVGQMNMLLTIDSTKRMTPMVFLTRHSFSPNTPTTRPGI
ncbi:kinase-like domain-containing protein [Syncephalis fuscata]|nr:kinase-like domain-containing protein [Syncephalis fuscata]